MKGDPTVIEFLNDGLRHELTSINQYWLHYRLLANWGLEKLAKKWRQESIEEMQHADRLMERIIFLDGMPNMQTLERLHIGRTVKEVIENDLAIEMTARSLYAEAAAQRSMLVRVAASGHPPNLHFAAQCRASSLRH
jgi:bacterioferritin